MHYLDNSWIGRLHPCDHQVRLLASCSILRPSPGLCSESMRLTKECEKKGRGGRGGGASQLVSPSYITWSPRQTESALFVKGEVSTNIWMLVAEQRYRNWIWWSPSIPPPPSGRKQNPVHHPLETQYDQVVDGWMNQDRHMSQSYKQSNFHLTLWK
jgi:hypothetical protein